MQHDYVVHPDGDWKKMQVCSKVAPLPSLTSRSVFIAGYFHVNFSQLSSVFLRGQSKRFTLTPLLLLIFIFSACANGPKPLNEKLRKWIGEKDVARKELHSFVLKKDEHGQYKLSSTVENQIVVLSPRAAEKVTYGIPERFYAPIDNIVALKNGSALSSSQIEKIAQTMTDVFISDLHLYLLKYKTLEVGDSIIFHYQQRYQELAFIPLFEVPNINYLEHYEVVFHHPHTVRVDFQLFFPRRQYHPQIVRHSGTTRIVFSNLQHESRLPLFPFNDFHALIFPQIREGKKPLHPIDAQTYANWYLQKLGKLSELSASDLQWLRQLVSKATTTRQKLKLIYEFVRDKIRYLADERNINNTIPRPPSKVLERRYGDCKDKAYLITHLAASLGIKTQLALISDKPYGLLPSIQNFLFNHILTIWPDPQSGAYTYLDATCTSCPFGSIPSETIGKTMLVLDKRAARTTIVQDPSMAHDLELDIYVSVKDFTKGKMNLTVRGALLNTIDHYKQTHSANQLQTLLSKFLGGHFYKMTFHKFTFKKMGEDAATLTSTVDLDDFVIRSKGRFYLPQTAIQTPCGDVVGRFGDGYPIYLGQNNNVLLRLHLNVEDGNYIVDKTPTNSFGTKERSLFFKSLLEQQKNEYLVTYVYQQDKKNFGEGERQQLMAFCQTYLRNKRGVFVFKANNDTPPAMNSALPEGKAQPPSDAVTKQKKVTVQ